MASFLTSTPTRPVVTSELAEKSFRVRTDLLRAQQSKPWLIFNVTLMALIAMDMVSAHFFIRLFIPMTYLPLTIIAEKTFFLLFALNSLFLIFISLKPFLWQPSSTNPIRLTSRQMKLLGVSDKSPLFTQLRAEKSVPSKDSSTFDLSWLYHVMKDRSTANYSAAADCSVLADYSAYSDGRSFTPSFTDKPSTLSAHRETYAESLMRLRRARSCSPFVSSASTISSKKQLKRYLKKARQDDMMSPDSSSIVSSDHLARTYHADMYEGYGPASTTSRSFLQNSATTVVPQQSPLSKTVADFSSLAGQKYHISQVVNVEDTYGTGTPETADGTLAGSIISAAELTVWLKFDIDPSRLDLLTHNARVWISKTIFKPVSAEIDTLNAKLSAYSPLTAIGSTNLTSLRQLILSQSDQFANLSSLLPYLELSTDQSYLVQRIKALARGTCLGEYSPFLTRYGVDINDFDIVLHFLRVYLTSRLVSNPLRIDDHMSASAATSRFFVLYPSKLPSAESVSHVHNLSHSSPHMQKLSTDIIGTGGGKKSLYILRPGPEPRIQIVYGNRTYDVGGKTTGTNNLFRGFVLFLQILKQDFNSRLISLSLGPSGLNLLWILD